MNDVRLVIPTTSKSLDAAFEIGKIFESVFESKCVVVAGKGRVTMVIERQSEDEAIRLISETPEVLGICKPPGIKGACHDKTCQDCMIW